jgi:endonuclease-3 related protein
MNKIQAIYEKLLSEYGEQGWWPYTHEDEDSPRYDRNNWKIEKSEREIFEIMMGAVLTQNTSWKNVEKAIISLRKNRTLLPEDILKTENPRLSELIRPAGYFNQKSRYLNNLSLFLKEHPIHELKKTDRWKLRDMFLSVKGIGRETADSIILYALGKEIFVIDEYTRRIFSRLGLCNEDIECDSLQKMIMDSLKPDARLFNEYHALLVEHAKRCCTKKASSEDCFLKKMLAER